METASGTRANAKASAPPPMDSILPGEEREGKGRIRSGLDAFARGGWAHGRQQLCCSPLPAALR
jgi:hypothetical protein